ncbi:DUF6929 family protein [Adhaeribacter aquaticus]|uniref:DUF6929 family protein n=1 Tax=Adhaeribacter aquaticus TaxID=299567 RepID=UPI000411FED6|nr:hypothetical protein [Adhaeribacter aquaticus]
MKAIITKRKLFREIPSASGMEVVGDKIYVIGDDSPLLYILNQKNLKIENKVQLFESEFFGNGRIPKAFKPDLECLTTLNINDRNYLAAFGSGAAPTRAHCYLIQLPEKPGDVIQIKQYSLQKLYAALQINKDLLAEDLLNIEAAASTSGQKLFLLQRSIATGPNVLLSFDKNELFRHLTDSTSTVPAYQAYYFELPHLSGLSARFSGAYTFADKLFFTASVENTTDAILDGQILGSFVGTIDLKTLKPTTKPMGLETALILNEEGEPFIGKVESLAILEKIGERTYRAIAMTDNDNGASEFLELEITL